MGAFRLIRPAETTLDCHFVVSSSRRDSIASSSWQCISRFGIIVRIRTLRKECDIVWGNRTEFSLSPAEGQSKPTKQRICYIDIAKDSPCSASLQGTSNRKRKPLCVHLHVPLFFLLSGYFLHQSELSSFHETESSAAARALLRHRCRYLVVATVVKSLCSAGNRCPE